MDGLFRNDAEIAKLIQYEYEVVHVDIGEWNKNLELVRAYGSEVLTYGIPYITILDSDGKVVVNQESQPFSIHEPGNPHHDRAKVLAFLKEHVAKPWKAEKRLEETLLAAQEHGRKAFVTFGAPSCVWCHHLEGWTHDPAIEALLAKDFVVLHVDIERDLGGADLMNEFRANEEGGIPWFAVLDQYGHAKATSDVEKIGNLGYPYTEPEVAAFVELLRGVRTHLTDEDLATLAESLHAARKADEEKKKKAEKAKKKAAGKSDKTSQALAPALPVDGRVAGRAGGEPVLTRVNFGRF